MKSIHVVLRTCDSNQVHKDWRVRYVPFSKSEIVKGCLTSLIRSCAQVPHMHLTVLDDHSSPETVKEILTQLNNSGISHEFIPLTHTGYNHSNLIQYEICKNSKHDLVYAVEDDYLHCVTAIKEMCESYQIFARHLNNPNLVLYPFDTPEEYRPPEVPSYVVHGSHRHWRTGRYTTCVVCTTPQIFKNHWDKFHLLATKYNGDYLKPRMEHYEESNTIWKIWQESPVVRFNPIPSLALHLQFEEQRDPFINWEQWWKSYAQ